MTRVGSASGRALDRLAHLEEERDFLLASLDDLDRERDSGELDDDEYETLRADYTVRAAAVLRAIEDDTAALAQRGGNPRSRLLLVAGLVIVGIVAGVTLARVAGQRGSGDTITGDIDRSVRGRLAEAENLYLSGEPEQSRELVDEILVDDRDLAGARLLSARLWRDGGDITAALADLAVVLEDEPANLDALVLRGNLLGGAALQCRGSGFDNCDEIAAAARVALDAAVAQEPPTFDAWLARARLAHTYEGDADTAIAMYALALERDPPPPMVGLIDQWVAELGGG